MAIGSLGQNDMLTVPERVAVRRDAERAAANVAELLRAAAGSLDSILDGRVGRKGLRCKAREEKLLYR